MNKTVGLVAAGLFASTLLSVPALAQQAPLCGQRADILKGLKDRFEEEPVMRGLDSQGRMVEVLAGTEGSWTMLVTEPTGTACLAAIGTAWSNLPAPKKGPVV